MALIIAVASAAAASAHTNRGAITGTVFDETAAVLPGATVTVIDVRTNIERHTTTSVTSAYSVTNLEPLGTAARMSDRLRIRARIGRPA